MAQKELPLDRPTGPIERLRRAVEGGRGITLDPPSASGLAEGINEFVARYAMAQHRLDVQSRITTALVTLLVGENDEPIEIDSAKFEAIQEDEDGFWVYYRPSTNSLLIGLGTIPEDIIEEVDAEVVKE